MAISIALVGSAAMAASPKAPLVPGGRIGTLTQGTYSCEMPGDASGPAGKAVPERSFRIVNASSYKADGIRGAYLLTGGRVTMTGGKLRGMALRRVSAGFLREVGKDGMDLELRCVLTSRR